VEHNELVESSEDIQSEHSESKTEEGANEIEIAARPSANTIVYNEDKPGFSSSEVENISCKESSEAELSVEHIEQVVCVTRSRGKARKYKTIFSLLLSFITIIISMIALLIRIESCEDYIGLVPT
jgi:hypothetical protein